MFSITEELANKILNYLVTRPFIEVHALIGELQQIKPANSKDDKEHEKIGSDK